MNNKNVWLITGAGRGLGLDIAKAALAAGNKVIATGRNTEKVAKAIGEDPENLLVVKLDITKQADAAAAVKAAVDKFGTAKFGMEGWMQALQAEVAPFGINTTIVNPGFFRTELLTEDSTSYAAHTIEEYNDRRAQQIQFWKGANGQQSGDPAKLAQALITIANEQTPPLRFIAGADAIAAAETVATTLQQQTNAYRDLSSSLDFDNK
jgi:NAD(P)-dependent dehydrogenase (short-subunit alcohol dehydrogenase family)